MQQVDNVSHLLQGLHKSSCHKEASPQMHTMAWVTGPGALELLFDNASIIAVIWDIMVASASVL